MNLKIHFFKIMLPLWSLMLLVTLISPQLTIANVIETAIAATSAFTETDPALLTTENDMKVLRYTTTAATIQLRLHKGEVGGGAGDVNNDLENTEKVAASATTKQLESREEVTLATPNSPALSSSFTTLASSNAPAIMRPNEAKEIVTRQQAVTEAEQQSQNNKPAIQITITPTLLQQYKNNDELEREIKETDSKQVTESVVAQHHTRQPITLAEVSWQKETDIGKQTTEGSRNAEKDLKIPATTVKQTHTSPAITTILPNTHYDSEDKAYASSSPAGLNKADHNKQKDASGNYEIESVTLTLAKQQPATENFKSVIKNANDKLIRERTVFASNNEWKQNLMPNELEYEDTRPLLSKTFEHNINWSPYLHPAATPVNDFTGKLLQEQDGVITEIEQKFRLNDFEPENEVKTTNKPNDATSIHNTPVLQLTQTTTFAKAATSPDATTYTVNRKILDFNKNPILHRSPVEFIERRVKKSFDFPMHRVASDAQHLPQHFDFANTKFNSNNNEPAKQANPQTFTDGQQKENKPPARPQPEFSTTKFYNSKELYNEMLQHKIKQQQPSLNTNNLHEKDMEQLNSKIVPSLTLNSFAVLHSPKIAKLEEIHDTKQQQQQQQQPQQKSLTIKKVTAKATKHTNTSASSEEKPIAATTSQTTSTSTETSNDMKMISPTKALSPSTLTEMPLAALVKTKKFQKELKRAKLLIKSMLPKQNTTARPATTDTNQSERNKNNELKDTTNANITTQVEQQTTINSDANIALPTTSQATPTVSSSTIFPYKSSTATTPLPRKVAAPAALAPAPALAFNPTNTPKAALHPIVRPRILSRLQEKINSLECELQNMPQDSHLWRGNETHELLLPIMICKPQWTPITWFANNRWVLRNSRNCSAASNTPENCKSDKDCTAMMVSWEGEAEIQSGDILIVEINDALLTPKEINLTTSAHNTQVYQVTRSGHEHCDVTEGILLDITPLIVDGRKLVTLYDKDLTEGVNLLIVVSELWGSQCVRLKVTTKTENCGESADCSGKGICFSNYDMEEYECQCCSGFAGPHCEEIDACTPSPCTNNGICVDLSQGHEGNSYQCLCPYGYTGKNCQYELDPCNPAECMNGGSCVGNSTHFRCDCSPGYTGPLCQHSLNECESSPCIHGICVDQEDGFRCFCQPGFAGELCNFEYNECESNPCQNGGECIDHIGSYECHCSKGYTGNRCQIKVDFCANKPCPEGRRCIDHGNDYSCECLGGRNGPDCNEMQRTQCNINPCAHGGTCWSSGDSFYCACRAGYTGTMCEDEFVVETVVSSSEFMVDDTSARNFNDKSFGSSVVLKSPIELHNAYTAAIVLALVIFFVALYLTICHCKVNQTYRKFSTRTYGFLPFIGFRLRTKQATSKISRHWLSGKGLGIGNAMRFGAGDGGATTSSSSTSALHATTTASSSKRNSVGHLPTAKASSGKQQHTHVGQLNERPFQRHLAMNLENDMYYTVDFSENSQHSPLIQ